MTIIFKRSSGALLGLLLFILIVSMLCGPGILRSIQNRLVMGEIIRNAQNLMGFKEELEGDLQDCQRKIDAYEQTIRKIERKIEKECKQGRRSGFIPLIARSEPDRCISFREEIAAGIALITVARQGCNKINDFKEKLKTREEYLDIVTAVNKRTKIESYLGWIKELRQDIVLQKDYKAIKAKIRKK